jgi:hypothetical protein
LPITLKTIWWQECAATGFTEIWLADLTTIDAFHTVQLFGVKPKEFVGLHAMRRLRSWKPYG